MDYSETLNLPKTDFPMRAKLPVREPEILEKWEEISIYDMVQKAREGKKKFVLHDGPPYANGDIHMGTALNKVLKDFIVKFKSMQGYDAPYIPGWDTHGLPIEHQIVKKKKVKRHKISVVEFRKMCRDYALKFVDIQRDEFKRLGIRGKWEDPYLTLSPEFEAKQVEVFGEMAKKGYIYKGLKPVYWCPDCETALAEAEIEYGDRRSPSIYVKFPVKDDKGRLGGNENTYVAIWTTTPWTIPANMAITLNPEFEYVLLESSAGERIMIAKGLQEKFIAETELQGFEATKSFAGKDLEGIICRHPLFDRESPLILGNHVTLEQGTGCVHTAPGHGQDDYEVGKKYGLEVYAPMNSRGVFTEEAGQFAGMHYDQVNKEVTKVLEEKGFLIKLNFMKHQYPHCWRCKKPVLFRATEQWFASVAGFRADALAAINDVRWIPAWGEERIRNMIKDRSDWCISRQRVWGVPIPIFYCEECGEALLNDKSIGSVKDIFAKEGSDAWFIREAAELLPQDIKCEKCANSTFRKEKDIMDVWFDSGSSHAAVCENREELTWPADMYLEGSDQYRGWFQSSLLTAVATRGQAPYRSVITHGWVVDGEGKKMSKSVGNVVAPEQIIKQYGADILRLWVSSADFKNDVRVSPDILKQLSEVYRKIRNTCRFLLSNCYDFDVEKDAISYNEFQEIDKYALHKLQELIKTVTKAFDEYDFHHLFHAIHNFCVVDMSNFYLDVIKDRLYVNLPESKTRRGAQTVLFEILTTLVKLIAPVLTFTSEELWSYLPHKKEESVQMTAWPEINVDYVDYDLAEKWGKMINVRDEVTKALEESRKNKVIGSSLQARVELSPGNETILTEMKPFESNLAELFIVSEAVLKEVNKESNENYVKVVKAEGGKCNRCWMHSSVIPNGEEGVCDRCNQVLEKI